MINPYKRHIMNLTPEQELHSQRIIDNCVHILPNLSINVLQGHLGTHWTIVFDELWKQRLNNNAKCTLKLKQIYEKTYNPLNLRIKYLNALYSDILNKLKYYEDLAYSHHYIFQIHFQYLCDSANTTNTNIIDTSSCLKHQDIEDYKSIEMDIEECFCNSLKNKPTFCLFCRDPKNFNYNYLNKHNTLSNNV